MCCLIGKETACAASSVFFESGNLVNWRRGKEGTKRPFREGTEERTTHHKITNRLVLKFFLEFFLNSPDHQPEAERKLLSC